MTTPTETPHEEGQGGVETTAAAADGTTSPAMVDIQEDIERTRQELANTVDALSAKLDFKARAGQRVATTKEQAVQRARVARLKAAHLAARAREDATDDHGRPKPAVTAGVVIVVVAVTAAAVWQHRRR